MTPQLQAAIAAIEPLNVIERQHLIQILLSGNPSAPQGRLDLTTQSQQFWDGIPLQKIRTTQNPVTYQPDQKSIDFWPETETIDDFLDRQCAELFQLINHSQAFINIPTHLLEL